MNPVEDAMETATHYYIGSEDGRSPGEISEERFQKAVLLKWPEALFTPVASPMKQVGDHLGFSFADEGFFFDGLFFPGRRASLCLRDVLPEQAAGFLSWYQALLPTDAELRITSEAAVSYGFTTRAWLLPRGGSREQIREALVNHLIEVYAEDNTG